VDGISGLPAASLRDDWFNCSVDFRQRLRYSAEVLMYQWFVGW
jgi:hypothetical protein